MSRTSLAYLQILLQNRWTEEINGRRYAVPQPHIVMASSREETRVSQYDGDVIFVVDGGNQSITPKDVGWAHEDKESQVSLDIRTSRSRERLEGSRNEDNEAERYGGLRGETKRILDSVRKGDKEFDWIEGYEWRDLSEDVGFRFWRGVMEVRLTQLADEINPLPGGGYGEYYGTDYGG